MASISVLLAAASPFRPLPADTQIPGDARQPSEEQNIPLDGKAPRRPAAGEGLANLPYAFGKRFDSLDDYLAHLERRAGPIDLPWWRQISPGVYEHMKHVPGSDREIATRAELLKRFGFSR